MADGSTYEEALTNVEGIIQEWIETAKDENRPIPELKGRCSTHKGCHRGV